MAIGKLIAAILVVASGSMVVGPARSAATEYPAVLASCRRVGATRRVGYQVQVCTKRARRNVWVTQSRSLRNDLQIVHSRGGFPGQSLRYSRSDADYKEFQSAVLVRGDSGYEIQAFDYHPPSKSLLFFIYGIENNTSSVFRATLGVAGARPTLVASGDSLVIDGKIDAKSGDPLLLYLDDFGTGNYRLVQYSSTGPITLWDAFSSGWLRGKEPLIFPRQIIPGTQGENWVAGSSGTGNGWRIDRISNRDGRPSVSEYMAGAGELGGVAREDVGGGNIYWAVATSTAYLMCKDPLLTTVFIPSTENCRILPGLGNSNGTERRHMAFVVDPGKQGAISLWDIASSQLITPNTGEVRILGVPGCYSCPGRVVNVRELEFDLQPTLTTWQILSDTSVG